MTARWPGLADIRVWSPLDDRRTLAAAMHAELGRRVAISEGAGAEATARDADLIVLVTSATEPVLALDWVQPGALVVAVGACRPTHRELDPALVADARVFVDSRDAALVESGDIVCGIAEGRFGPGHVRGELGDVLLGRIAARETAGDRVIFKSLGLAVEDVTVADEAVRRALDTGLGTAWSF
jgi:ornithine cyclodeaminase/alanine dehydrogenase-like protein (mu-crystallin family)